LHAAHLLDVDTGRIVTPGEILIDGERFVAAGSSARHPGGAQVIDHGDTTLLFSLWTGVARRSRCFSSSRNRRAAEPLLARAWWNNAGIHAHPHRQCFFDVKK
jgi:hypothetical protein